MRKSNRPNRPIPALISISLSTLPLLECGCSVSPAGAEPQAPGHYLVIVDGESAPEEERTPEGYIRCDPANFVPKEIIFIPVLDETGGPSELSFFLQEGDSSATAARLYIYGARTECVDQIHQLAFYGDFATSILTEPNGGTALFFVSAEGREVQLGSSADGFTSCNPAQAGTCPLMVKKERGQIVFEVYHQGIQLLKQTYQAGPPRHIPVVG